MPLRAAIIFLGSLLTCPLMAQQLFPDGAGWYREPGYRSTAAQRRLYWTPDWGAHWNDITPKIPDGYQLGNIFFLDRSRGWVFLVPLCGARGGMLNTDSHATLKLAFTANSGKSWKTWDVRLPNYSQPFSVGDGAYCVTFVDADHGWMRLGLVGPPVVSGGPLLRTEDSGRTWQSVSESPTNVDCVKFANARDGWMTDASAQLRIWRTQDGGNSWLDVSPSVPMAFGTTFGDWGIVVQSHKQVFVPVLFTPAPVPFVLLFLTEDQGRSWTKYITLPSPNWNRLPLSVVGSTIITGELSKVTRETPKQILMLTTATAKGVSKKQQSEAPSLPPLPGRELPACPTELNGLNMTDENHGWAYVSCGITDMLFATADAGKSWSNVSPAAVPEMTDYRLGGGDTYACPKVIPHGPG
jgi:hypothetical protein